MLLALGFVVGLLFLIKRFLEKKLPQTKSGVKIISHQMIDSKNKITIFHHKNKEYIIATGESGFLIDKKDITKEDIENDNDH